MENYPIRVAVIHKPSIPRDNETTPRVNVLAPVSDDKAISQSAAITGTTTDVSTYPTNTVIRPPRNNVTDSFIMVENVENPPRKPVAKHHMRGIRQKPA